MAEIQEPESPEISQTQPNSGSTNVGSLHVNGNIERSVVVIGNNNVVHYHSIVENNTEQHEPDYWALKHPYPMPPNFTGRIAERALLTHWLKEDSENRLLILRALGGFGKSALSWQWLTHDVDIKEFPKVIWWSFYEGDSSFEHFIEETLNYLKLDVPVGHRLLVDELLRVMGSQKILLIMDGFERVLRLYGNMNAAYQSDEETEVEDHQLDCVNVKAEIFLKSVCSLPDIKSKVLMTTRLTPRAVKVRGELMLGCREEELTAIQKRDAVDFFHKQKIKGTRAEIEAACAPYGYHLLSLRILAGLILNDREIPGDIEVVKKLDITDDIIQNKNHVLKVSYDSLSFGQQKLVSNMACFRSSISYQSLKFITSKPSWRRKINSHLNEKLNDSLQILETRGLLQWDRKTNKYDLHPIVRRYAYERLTDSDHASAHARIRDYFATVSVRPKPQTIDDLSPVIELYHHTVQAGEYKKAFQLLITKLVPNPLHFQFGAYQLIIELERALFDDDEYKTPKLNNEAEHAWLYNSLANSYSMSGQPLRALPLFEQQNKIQEKSNQRENSSLAFGLGNIAFMAEIYIGSLRSAESHLQLSIAFFKKIGDDRYEATMSIELGRLLAYCGEWEKSGNELEAAKKVSEKYGVTQTNFGSGVYAYHALRSLLIIRDPLHSKTYDQKSSIEYAHRAMVLAEEHAKLYRPVERDFVLAHWLLGAAYRVDFQLELAGHHLGEALTRCRTINIVELEANILLDLASLRYDQKNYEEAKSLAEEALLITERCGYVLQGADVNLFLAQYALEQEKDKAKAKEYAETALKLAYCDGPPYYYKVAYHEAERMLEKLA